MCLGPTHEEVITDLVRDLVNSYKQLPITLYQIQTKFRDEPRPRFGIVRTREFVMKDAYSFDADVAQLDKSYDAMYEAYCRIFDRCGLPYVIVEAESGPIGGDASHEFMVPCSTGEDRVIQCTVLRLRGQPGAGGGRRPSRAGRASPTRPRRRTSRWPRPNKRTIRDVCEFLKVEETSSAKLLVFLGDGKPVAVLLRGDHEANEAKVRRAFGVSTLVPADAETIEKATGAPMGFLGPVAIKIPMIVDRAIAAMSSVVVGGNEVDVHLKGVVPGRDFPLDRVYDLRNADAGDPCPRCGAPDGEQGRARDRPRLQARDQVLQGDGGDVPRREGDGDPHHHGLLRHRHQPDHGGGHRGRPRRQRHPLAALAGSLPGGARPAAGEQPGRHGDHREDREGARGGRDRRAHRRSRPAPGREVQGHRPDRHSAPGRDRRTRAEGRVDRGQVADRAGRAGTCPLATAGEAVLAELADARARHDATCRERIAARAGAKSS